jgi:hypothetical protein
MQAEQRPFSVAAFTEPSCQPAWLDAEAASDEPQERD